MFDWRNLSQSSQDGALGTCHSGTSDDKSAVSNVLISVVRLNALLT